MRRLLLRLCALAGLGVWLAGCPVPNLYDPQADPVMVGGLELDVVGTDSARPSHLEYRLRIYGYRIVNGNFYLHYLEAGDVTVSGLRARRTMVRVGEPEYRFEGVLDSLPMRLHVQVSGSEQVRPCDLEIGLPALPDPPRGGDVKRGEDLVLPLHFAPDPLPPEQSIGARVELSNGSSAVALERQGIQGALVVPERFLAEVPSGPATLELHLEWRQLNPPGRGRCAPQVEVQAVYDARRRVLLH